MQNTQKKQLKMKYKNSDMYVEQNTLTLFKMGLPVSLQETIFTLAIKKLFYIVNEILNIVSQSSLFNHISIKCAQ